MGPDTLANRMAQAAFLAGIVLVLAGCPGARRPAAEPLAEPVGIEVPGPIVHAGAGIEFPLRLAEFARHASKRYDTAGDDLGVGYTRVWRDAVAEVTVYVYPGPDGADEQSARDHLEAVLAEVRANAGDLQEVERVAGMMSHRGADVPFAAAEVLHGGGREFFGRRVVGVASVVPIGGWWLKVRMTTPAEGRDRALAALEELLAALRLPATGLPATRG